MRVTSSLFLAAVAATGAAADSLALRLITYNIRLDSEDLEDGEVEWSTRRPLMASQLNDQMSESNNILMCFQEGFRSQLQDLQQDFEGDRWDFLGEGRDGGRDGEYSSVLYQSAKWELDDENTYWLTEGLKDGNNEKGAKGWDATHPRIMNIARLRHKGTGAYVVYICTHLEYEGEVASAESAKLVAEYADKWSEGGKYPVFVGGDLNHEPDSDAYKNMAAKMTDAKGAIPKDKQSGFTTTYTGFDMDTDNDELLDYIFVLDKDSVELVGYNVLNNKPADTWISDHRPVVVDVGIPY